MLFRTGATRLYAGSWLRWDSRNQSGRRLADPGGTVTLIVEREQIGEVPRCWKDPIVVDYERSEVTCHLCSANFDEIDETPDRRTGRLTGNLARRHFTGLWIRSARGEVCIEWQ